MNTDSRKHQCKAKRQFPSREAAVAIGTKMEPYLCRFCGGWHLTSGMVGRINKQVIFGLQASNSGYVKPSRVKRQRRERFTRKKLQDEDIYGRPSDFASE